MLQVRHSSCRRDIWLASFNSDQLDVLLGYVGAHAFRKLWLGYFRASNASEVECESLYIRNITKGGMSVLTGELVGQRKKVKDIKVDHRKHESNCKNMYA
jgi:hypothetical protein